MAHSWKILAFACILSAPAHSQISSFPYLQDFEASPTYGEAVTFYPGWWGNDVRNTTSRIHFWDTHPAEGLQALAVVPTSTYQGEIRLSLDLRSLTHPTLVFQAASDANGSTSTRPAWVWVDWSTDGGNTYSPTVMVGDSSSFPNADFSGYRDYHISLPDSLTTADSVWLRWTVARGEGSGSAARWLLDSVALVAGGPQILTLTATSAQELSATWDSPLDSAYAVDLSHYQLSTSTLTAASWNRTTPTRVTFAVDSLPNGRQTLVARGLANANGDVQITPDSASFTYLHLALTEAYIISDTSLYLQANQPLDLGASGFTLGSYTLSRLALTNSDSALSLGFQPALGTGEEITLTLDSLYNASGNSFLTTALPLTYTPQLRALSSQPLDSLRVQVHFNLALDSATASQPEHYQTGQGASVIHAAWDAQEPKSVVLTWPQTLHEGSHSLTLAGVLPSESGALAMTETTLTFSYLPLRIVSSQITGPQSLRLVFNQPIKTFDATQISADGEMGHPSSLVFADDTVSLAWDSTWVHHYYTLTFTQLSNSSGNARLDTTVSHFYAGTLPAGSLVINEIFADPNPKGLLPDSAVWPTESSAEFVEVYNRSARSYSLAGSALSGAPLDTLNIAAGGYAVLSANATPYGHTNVLAVSKWNSLTNAGEPVWLSGPDGSTLDSVRYSAAWYQDAAKDGGWSLERINPFRICSDETNWIASSDATGATPGFANHQLDLRPDTTAPSLIDIVPDLPSGLSLVFSELLAPNTQLSGNSQPPLAWTSDLSTRSVLLSFSDTLLPDTLYRLALAPVADCEGNLSDSLQASFFWDTQPPVLLDRYFSDWHSVRLVWNEPLRSDSLRAEDFRTDTSPAATLHLDEAGQLLTLGFAQSYVATDTLRLHLPGSFDLAGNRSQADTLTLIFENAIDTVIALTDRVASVYFTRPVGASALMPEHYFLGDVGISPASVLASGQQNRAVQLVWPQSLKADRTYTLSIDSVFDTLGNRLGTPSQALVWDQEAPKLDSVWALNAQQTVARFHEPVDSTTATLKTHYTLVPGDFVPSQVLRLSPQEVLLSWSVPIAPETDYTLEVRKVADVWGNTPSQARTYAFRWDTVAPRLLDWVALSDTVLRFRFSEAASVENLQINGLLLDSLWAHPYDGSLQYGTSHSGWAGASQLSGTATDAYGHSRTLHDSLDLTQPRWTRSGVLSRTEALLWGYPELTLDTMDVANFTLLDHTLTRWEKHPQGGYILQWEPPLEANASHTVVSTWPNGLHDSLVIMFAEPIAGVTWVSPQLLQVNYQDDLASFAPLAGDFPRLAPDSLVPNHVIRGEKSEQWVFQDSLRENVPYTLHIPAQWDGWERYRPATSATLIRDTQAPTVDRISFTGRWSLTVTLSEAASVEKGHVRLSPQAIFPLSVQKMGAKSYRLRFAELLPDSGEVWLVWEGIQDESGNTSGLDSIPLPAASWPEVTSGVIQFTEIMADPSPALDLPEEEYVELTHQAADSLWMEGWRFTDGRDTATLPAKWWSSQRPLLLTRSAAGGLFGDSILHISLARFPGLNNGGETLSLLDHAGTLLAQLSYSDAWHTLETAEAGGVALERVPSNNPCLGSEAWASSLHPSGGTPGFANSLTDWSPDTTAPRLVSAGLAHSSALRLSFSEAVDTTQIPMLHWPGGQQTTRYVWEAQGQACLVQFDPPLDSGHTLSVSITGIVDCPGQTMADTTLHMQLGRAPRYLELIFSEIRPHPTDEVPLPLGEYIELYNQSTAVLNLGGVRWHDATGNAILPEYALGPKQYLILCPSSQVALWEHHGAVLGVPGWRTLNKSGEPLRLYTAQGKPLHQVEYPPDWHEEGPEGSSWELASLGSACKGASVWKASPSPAGGTPGVANAATSDAIDRRPPALVEAGLLDSTQIALRFDEPLLYPDRGQTRWILDPGSHTGQIVQTWEDSEWLRLSLDQPLAVGIPYRLAVQQFADCSGNVQFTAHSVTVARPERAQKLDIVLNEVLFDPRSGGEDFLEIYNRSPRFLDLTGWSVGADTIQISGTILPQRLLGWGIPPQSYRVLTRDAASLSRYFPGGADSTFWEVPGLANFPNGTGEIALWSDTGERMEALAYSEAWHSALLRDTEGVSLERLSRDTLTQWASNWGSAAETYGYGTPGLPNSQTLPNLAPQAHWLSASPRAFNPDGTQGASFSQISFEVPGPGYWGSLVVYNQQGRAVRTLLDNSLVPVVGWVRWDGLLEDGARASTGPYWVRGTFYTPEGAIQEDQVRIIVSNGL